MLGDKVVGVIACVQVSCKILDIEAGFGEVLQRLFKKLVVVGLEVDLAAVSEKMRYCISWRVWVSLRLLCLSFGHGLQKLMYSLSARSFSPK